MIILGIESSCDETAVAVVKNGYEVLASKIYSQIDRHQLFGGVVPEIAAREHLRVIDPLVQSTLAEADLSINEIDAIAVTQGPGLIGALLVGASYAKGLALGSRKPLICVNHVHAHVHGALLDQEPPLYPALALVVSGGHTNIYYMTDPVTFELLAHTVDDACGECFDKVAKLFGLGYPGGPAVEKLARQGDGQSVAMPRMVEQKNRLQFSYSGLKTYMVNLLKQENTPLPSGRQADILASFQEEALHQLVRKLTSAWQARQQDVKTILIAGGVAANQRFREMMAETLPIPIRFPNLRYCSDNGAMIAGMGYYLMKDRQRHDANQSQNISWDCYSSYPY